MEKLDPPSPSDKIASTENTNIDKTDAAHDLESIRKAVEDAASVSTGLWISYLFMFFYIAVAAGAVTHLDLLLENSVKLPFLGIELPLRAFFFIAPLLFLIAHAYTLVHFVLLGRKSVQFDDALHSQFPSAQANAITEATGLRNREIRNRIRHFFIAPLLFLIAHAYTLVHFVLLGRKSVQFDDALHSQFPSAQANAITEATDLRNREIRNRIRQQLPSNIFVQFLAGPRDVRNTGFGRLLRFIAWITLVFGPIVLLLELQIQFLPYHNLKLTWEHRLAILVDIILIWWLWKKIVGHGDRQISTSAHLRIKTAAGAILSVLAIWFSWSLAIIPGEQQEFTGCAWLYEHLFNGGVDPNTHRPTSLFSNRLVLPRLNVYDILKVDDPQKVAWRPYLLALRGRDLKGAIFDEAFLPRTDARSAQLQGASLFFASLQGSMLRDANLQGANLPTAQLQGANLVRAHLEGAELSGAALQGANLESAHLTGADLPGAQLQGVNFHGADLSGANLFLAPLRGAAFGPIESSHQLTNLQGANFGQAMLDVISLDRALLWRSVFASDDKLPMITKIFGTPEWAPKDMTQPWGKKSYKKLQDTLMALPESTRTTVLSKIKILDCSTDNPCDQASVPPAAVQQWQDEIKNATLDQADYAKALASVYYDLICSGDSSSLAVVRSLAGMGMPEAAGGTTKAMGFLETGTQAAELVDRIMSSQCHVSAQLTDADKALLLTVKRLSASADTSTTNTTPQ